MRGRFSPLILLIPLVLLFLVLLLVDCPEKGSPPAPAPASKPAPARLPAPAEKKTVPRKTEPRPAEGAGVPRAALIVDDLGYNLEAIEILRSIGRPITVAILPYATLTEESARLAAAGGLEIMLHLPIESAGNRRGAAAIEGTIVEGMPDADIRAVVERSLARIPGVRGVNNHTGSLGTEDSRLMKPILEVIKARGLYFVDSRTSKDSVAYEEALGMGIPAASRNVFIDAEPGEKEIALRLRELFRLARKYGRAVGICHPKRETLTALSRQIGRADAHGVRLVFASDIVR